MCEFGHLKSESGSRSQHLKSESRRIGIEKAGFYGTATLNRNANWYQTGMTVDMTSLMNTFPVIH